MAYVLHTGIYPEKKVIHAQEIRVLYLITGNDAHVQVYKRQPKKPVEALCAAREDCKVLARAVVFEARGESVVGQQAVAAVIMNRVENDKFPDTVKDVVYQKHQFSFVKDMHKQKPPTKKDIDTARRIAYNVITKKVASPVGKALYFHSVNVNPVWSRGMKKKTIGNHKFF